MTHLLTPRQPFHKEPAVRFAIAAAFVVWALFSLSGCEKQESKSDIQNENLRRVYLIGWRRGADVMIDAVNSRILGKKTSLDATWIADSIWFEKNIIKE